MDTVLHEVLANTYTKSDLYHRFGLIREFGDFLLYQNHRVKDLDVKEALSQFLDRKEESDRHTQAIQSWGKAVWGTLLAGSLNDNLNKLYEKITSLPIMVLYVPEDLLDVYIDTIGGWLRSEVSNHLLLDVRTSPRVAGGCAFSLNGRFYDYSFTSQLSDHHNEIVSLIQNTKIDSSLASAV